jgi:PAS domain S-box-containing protein
MYLLSFFNPIYWGSIISTLIISVGGLSTAVLAMYGIWSKMLKPFIKESRHKRDRLAKAIDHIESISTQLEEVSKELKPNGGGSIKDQVKQISTDIKVIRAERDTAFYLSKDAMFKNNANGLCTNANTALCRLFGAQENEMLGLGWTNFVIEEDKERIIDEWQANIEFGNEIISNYTIENKETGKLIKVQYRALIMRDDDESIISIVGIVEKIKNSF